MTDLMGARRAAVFSNKKAVIDKFDGIRVYDSEKSGKGWLLFDGKATGLRRLESVHQLLGNQFLEVPIARKLANFRGASEDFLAPALKDSVPVGFGKRRIAFRTPENGLGTINLSLVSGKALSNTYRVV